MTNTPKTLDEWVTFFTKQISTSPLEPSFEIFLGGLPFSDWRLSYGIKRTKTEDIYFVSIYPAFCLSAKYTKHYLNMEDMLKDVLVVDTFLEDSNSNKSIDENTALKDNVRVQDVIAAVFAISRNKESIELFQDQKDLMDLGLRHIHLDNYYQDMIKVLCKEYYSKGTIQGKVLDCSIITSNTDTEDGANE